MNALRLMVVLPGESESLEYLLTGDDARTGRASFNDIIIPHDTVSSAHGLFTATPSGYVFRDVGSRNGSAICRAGQPTEPFEAGIDVTLGPGDVLLLGADDDTGARIEVHQGHAPYVPHGNLLRTVIAERPLAVLGDLAHDHVVHFSAQCIRVDSPDALADAITALIEALHPDRDGEELVLVGTGFQLHRVSGGEPPLAWQQEARNVDLGLRVIAEGGQRLVVVPLGGAAWRGCLQLWGASFVVQPRHLDTWSLVGPLVGWALERLSATPARRASEVIDVPGPVGDSPAFRGALALARRFAPTPLPVLVRGETGVGKEVVARAIHGWSGRSGPFVAVNCAAIAESLIESELFGHVQGAYTGATSSRPGLIEQSDGGTLFLDEIGEMPLALQTRLLRVLEDKAVRRVGGTRERPVDLRVISATHRDLAAMTTDHTFREDLLYRLDVAQVEIPPLRQRGFDILGLAHFLAGRAAAEQGKCILGISGAAAARLMSHRFPGNVRELRNEMSRAVALTEDGAAIDADALSPRLLAHTGAGQRPPAEAPTSLKEWVSLAERHAIQLALAEHDGAMTRAAQALGITRAGLYKSMVRLGMRRPGGGQEDPGE